MMRSHFQKAFIAFAFALSVGACSSGGGSDGGSSTDVDLTPSQRAALVAQLEGLEAQLEDSGQAQAARAARGAALAVQGGTSLTSVSVAGAPLRSGLQAGAATSGTPWAMGYQLDVVNMQGRTTPLRLYGALASTTSGVLVVTGGESTDGPIPPAFGALTTSASQLWLAGAAQASSSAVVDGGACPIPLSLPGVACSLATFRAGFDVTASTAAPIAGNDATGSQTATLAAGPDLRGVKLTVDCAQATALTASLLCRWVPQPQLTLAFAGSATGTVAPTPARAACLSSLAPCSWGYATGTTVALRATGFGSPSSFHHFDGDLADGGWTTMTIPFGNGGTATSVQQATGGNPGAARRVTLAIQGAPGPDTTSSVVAFHWKSGAIYDPRTQGAVASVDASQDHRAAPGPQFVAFAIRQNGYTYLTSSHLADSQAWTRFTELGLTSSSFTEVSIYGTTAAQPDFSATGKPMEFGFYRAASTGYGGAGYTTAADVDNWMVNVRTQGSVTPRPVWTGCSDTDPDGVCYVNLADDRTVSLAFE